MMKLQIFSWLFILIAVGNCESNESGESSEEDDAKQDDIGNATTIRPEIAAGSRRMKFGTLVTKAPDYLVHAFGAHHDLDEDHGRLKGFGILVHKDHMIVHHNTFNSLNQRPANQNPDHGPHLFHPAPPRIHVNQEQPVRKYNHDLVQGNLGGSKFHLVKNRPYNQPAGLMTPAHVPPVLEKNKQEFGTNCHMISYASGDHPNFSRQGAGALSLLLSGVQEAVKRLPNPPPKPQEWDRKFPQPVRNLAMLPVKLKSNNCTNGLCRMKITTGLTSCGSYAHDHGAPIVCGEQKKVTYLTHNFRGQGGCVSDFEAFHVPHMIDDLNKGLGGSSRSG